MQDKLYRDRNVGDKIGRWCFNCCLLLHSRKSWGL